ncbi:MAG TPA: iron ABC transporter permease [Bauldia sp.]|nr:iron ABC transporter permease [Bauldia sp.]
MTTAVAGASMTQRRTRDFAAIGIAAALAVTAAMASLVIGPIAIPPQRVAAILFGFLDGTATAGRDAVVVLDVRLPRTVLGVLVGASTALAGAVMQGLFRNPLADPGVVGVSSGAGLAAALWFILGAGLGNLVPWNLGTLGLPLSAFAGGLIVSATLHLLSRREGQTSATLLLLAGIAIGAFTSAGVGVLVFIASEQQLREFTFWTLGSLGGATSTKIALVLPFALAFMAVAPRLARGLDALALGEAEAFHLGIDVERLKRVAVIGVAAAVGASVAVSGVVGFVGLITPHVVRLVIGPAHRLLLPVTALAGATFLVTADIVARTIAAPSEIPLGVITAGVGAPFMLWLLLRQGLAQQLR